MQYFSRHIDSQLLEWKQSVNRNPLLIRGARQVGKSTAVRHLAKSFSYFVEVNFEKQPSLKQFFPKDINVKTTCEMLEGTLSVPIIPGKTLLFIDEIQECKEAIMALRYFKEDYPELHVIAAGSLLEFAMEELSSFGVGRIRSLYMYPFSFDEFLMAQGLDIQVRMKKKASSNNPLPDVAHHQFVSQLKSYYLVGGMPAAVAMWKQTGSYLEVARVHNDIIDTYHDDFAKYNKRISPALLRKVLRSVALQVGSKFVYTQADSDVRSSVIKEALYLLSLAGLIIPVIHSDANGVPLGAEENDKYVKYLLFDTGIMQTLLDIPAADILMADTVDFVNKGSASEMFAGLEMVKYADSFRKCEMHYWQNNQKNSQAEVDYLLARNGKILPIEVKANTRGSMQSLWVFMRSHHLCDAVRTSLENFAQFDYVDTLSGNTNRHIEIIPLYALSNL